MSQSFPSCIKSKTLTTADKALPAPTLPCAPEHTEHACGRGLCICCPFQLRSFLRDAHGFFRAARPLCLLLHRRAVHRTWLPVLHCHLPPLNQAQAEGLCFVHCYHSTNQTKFWLTEATQKLGSDTFCNLRKLHLGNVAKY